MANALSAELKSGPGPSFKARASAWLVRCLSRMLWRTCTITLHGEEENVVPLLRTGQPFLPCYWHQMHVICAHYLFGLNGRDGFKLGFLISPSQDGEIASLVVRHLGAAVVRGSSSSTGARALRDCYQAVANDGISLVFTADGPRGPLHEFKSGALLVARLTGTPILPLGYRASRAWHLDSWDRFIVPKPFAHIDLYFGDPYYVPKDAPLDQMERYRLEIQSLMRSLVPGGVDQQSSARKV